MRIPSGKTDQVIYFVAVDATDLKTRETGLSSFTVYRSRNGGAATIYTTPTVSELSAGNMPGVYSLLIDEDTTIAAGSDSEEYVVHITQASMAPVTRTIELYRRDTTSGQTATVTSGGVTLADGVSHGGTLGSSTATLALSRQSIVSQSANTSALTVTGNGTGNGATITSGSGATGDGVQMIAASTNGDGLQLTKTGTGSDLNATVTPLVLAKTTNITGFNDIAATAVVSAGAITTSGGAVSTVTTLTNLPAITANWLTAAGTAADFGTEVAAAVWQDAVAGDFTVASSIGKALYIANIAPGASGGHFISGSNAGTTTVGALTVTGATTLTGNVSMAAGLNITQSSANTTALVVTGNGTGNGATITSGSGATGDGVQMIAASTNGDGLQLTKTGTGSDLNATVTPLVLAKTTNITGFNDIAATAIVSAGAITTLAGAVVNVDLVDVLTTYTGNTVQTGDSFARIGANGAGLTATVDLVWDEAIAGHLSAGSTGLALNSAGAAGDPWSTAVPGAYGAGTAGFVLGTNLDATVSSRLATAGYTAPPSAATIADAVHDEVVDGVTTFRESTRLHNSAMGGKASGLETATAVYRDLADTKDRVTATVDADGNRTAVVRDLT